MVDIEPILDIQKELNKAKDNLVRLLTRKAMTEEALEKARQNLGVEEVFLLNAEKARTVAQIVAAKLQEKLEYQISNIVTMALSSVFTDPYEFKVKFTDRRNQTECDMFFVKDGNECDPMESSGGGAKDIAALALQMAIWSIKKTRAIQILDEPAKFLSRDMQEKCSSLLKMLSDDLGIQMIIVSHIPEIMESADRIINVENIEGYSKVSILK
jgi:DNA repair exonuclease SbcCD ATPase subunit